MGGTTTVSATQGAPAVAPPPPAQEARPADQVRLTGPVNPYADLSDRTATVRADAWKKGPNGSVEQILARQGYSREDMYRKDADGHTLIERVANVNHMADPNLLREGQNLLVPVKPEQRATPAPQNGNGTAPQARTQSGNGNGTHSVGVTVDRWRQGPNDSLEHILQGQGYSLGEIHRKDRNGRTMIDRVAASNGLENANNLREGQRLVVPGRRQEQQGQNGQGEHHQEPPAQPEPPARPEPPVQPEPPVRPEPPVQPEPPAPPQPPPTQPPEDGNATSEMGLLLAGARDHKFTRDEFRALNSTANRYEEVRSEYGKDGFSNAELRNLGQIEQQYGQMYSRFEQHDRSRIQFEGSNSNDPRVQARMRMLDESGALWDGFVNGTLSYEDAAGQLMAQRARARQLGAGGQ